MMSFFRLFCLSSSFELVHVLVSHVQEVVGYILPLLAFLETCTIREGSLSTETSESRVTGEAIVISLLSARGLSLLLFLLFLIDNSADCNRRILRSLNFDERMFMRPPFFACFTEVKVLADAALVPDTDYREYIAAITANVTVGN